MSVLSFLVSFDSGIIAVEEFLGSYERCDLSSEHLVLHLSYHVFDGRIVVEAVFEVFVDAFVHPVF